jgi:hypothetical protein
MFLLPIILRVKCNIGHPNFWGLFGLIWLGFPYNNNKIPKLKFVMKIYIFKFYEKCKNTWGKPLIHKSINAKYFQIIIEGITKVVK